MGNFNGDTQSIGNEVYDFDDLAIGIPGEDGVGAVLILYGSQWNLLFGSNAFLGEFDWGSLPEPDDYFGWSLAAADFDGNGADDLAIGAPFEDLGGRTDTGLVTVLYGQMFAGFNLGLNEWWSQATIFGAGAASTTTISAWRWRATASIPTGTRWVRRSASLPSSLALPA